jgi:hypothetical protein
MRTKQILLGLAVAIGGVASAHHLSAGLSFKQGPEVVTHVSYFQETSPAGIPAYHVSTDEVGHQTPVGLSEGDALTLVGANGSQETIVFSAADFADIASATAEEVLEVLAAKSALADAHEDNGYLVIHGAGGGGSLTSLELQDGAGEPLAKLSFAEGTLSGSDALELQISVPTGGPDLAGHPYLILASATPGASQVKGTEIPIGIDGSTREFFALTMQGLLPGFAGRLDVDSDSEATLDLGWIEGVYGPQATPFDVQFALVVFDPALTQVEYVSNAFTLHVL